MVRLRAEPCRGPTLGLQYLHPIGWVVHFSSRYRGVQYLRNNISLFFTYSYERNGAWTTAQY
jgi:hypothetical protein